MCALLTDNVHPGSLTSESRCHTQDLRRSFARGRRGIGRETHEVRRSLILRCSSWRHSSRRGSSISDYCCTKPGDGSCAVRLHPYDLGVLGRARLQIADTGECLKRRDYCWSQARQAGKTIEQAARKRSHSRRCVGAHWPVYLTPSGP